LANIAGDSSSYRDLALSHGALPQLLAQFNETVNISLIRNATWALSNFCLGKPQPQFDQVRRIHYLALLSLNFQECLIDVLMKFGIF